MLFKSRGKRGRPCVYLDKKSHTMNLLSILLIAVGLAMDAFAVSITYGLTLKKLKIKHAFTIALFFGFFQGAMPIIGWLAGVGFRDFISTIDHWIAFGLLVVIGGKMIYESFKPESSVKNRELSWTFLLFLSIATSHRCIYSRS